VGDGKVFIYPVESVVRVRTGEKDGELYRNSRGNYEKEIVKFRA
jgi:hypothetical protein